MTDAERLASLLWPEVFNRPFHDVARAQRAIDAGWTPPDPHFAIARDISALIYPSEEFDPFDGEDEDWDFDALVDGLVHFALRSGSQEVPHVVAH